MTVIAAEVRDRQLTFVCGRHTVKLTTTELAKVLCGQYPRPTLDEIEAKRLTIPEGQEQFCLGARCLLCWGCVHLFDDNAAGRAIITAILGETAQRDGEVSIDPKRKARNTLAKYFLRFGHRGLDIDSFFPPLLEKLMLAGIDYDESVQLLNQMWVEFVIIAEF